MTYRGESIRAQHARALQHEQDVRVRAPRSSVCPAWNSALLLSPLRARALGRASNSWRTQRGAELGGGAAGIGRSSVTGGERDAVIGCRSARGLSGVPPPHSLYRCCLPKVGLSLKLAGWSARALMAERSVCVAERFWSSRGLGPNLFIFIINK